MNQFMDVMAAAGDVDEIKISFNENSMVILRVVIACIMFGIALGTTVDDFRQAIRRPLAISIAIAAQFILLPFITFCLTLILGVRGSVALGMILVACCPPGNVSNIVTHLSGGDVALSVSMTAVGNLLAIFLMPLNFALWGGLHPTGSEIIRAIDLSAWDMLSEVLLVIGVPFAVGITVAHFYPKFAARGSKIVGPIAFAALGGLILISLLGNWALFLDWIGVVAIAVAIHDGLALGLGYSIARTFKLAVPQRKAMTFEVGVRNAGLGLLIVFSNFDGLGGMALVAAWWGIWDIIAALTVARIWRRHTLSREPAVAAA
ncbi:MAG: bile acid:sodium symporter family protein [Candidatus Nanopelagicales bacterium]